VVLAQYSDQVLNAILTAGDPQDLLLARKVEDLRRRVLELAAFIREPNLQEADWLADLGGFELPYFHFEKRL
jgi:hydroxymethylpyrimidine/phosphomethylpyrimidine kinase